MALDTLRTKPHLLRQLQRDLIKRRSIVGGYARESLDHNLLQTVTDLGQFASNSTQFDRSEGMPPRRVAYAMAMAIYALPYIGKSADHKTLHPWSHSAVFDANHELYKPPSAASISASLGLSGEEVEALREKLERRFCSLLSQHRTITALCHLFDIPRASVDPLFQQLFPVVPQEIGSDSVSIVGTTLYSSVKQDETYKNEALFLPWITTQKESLYPPLHTFHPDLLDEALVRSLGKSLGIDQVTLNRNLRNSIVLLPTDGVKRLIRHDLWRSSGAAHMTNLCEGYTPLVSSLGELDVADLNLRSWLLDATGEVCLDHVELAFSGLLSVRLEPMLHHLHAELVASLAEDQLSGSATRIIPTIDDLNIYDISHHVSTLATPLLEAVTSEEAVKELASIGNMSPAGARKMLEKVASAWRAHLKESWLNSEHSTHSMHSLLTCHLIGTRVSLRELLNRPHLNNINHRNLLLLFSGLLLADTKLETLSLGGPESDVTWPPADSFSTDEIGEWFWTLWQRLAPTILPT